MPVVFAPCLCDPDDQTATEIRARLLETFNSVLAIFDEWEREVVASYNVEFLLLEYERCVILINGKDTHISFPLICGTRLWILWQQTPASVLAANGIRLAQRAKGNRKRQLDATAPITCEPLEWACECCLCKTHTTAVPTTICVNGARLFHQFYSIIDSARPRVIKAANGDAVSCDSCCFIDGKLVSCTTPQVSTNPILTTSGCLATQRVYPITQTFVKKLSRLVEWARKGSLTAKQAQLESTKLFAGNIDGVFSARAAYQSHEDYDESCQSKLVNGFERNASTRYQQLKTTTVQRFVYPLSLYKLIRASHHVTSNRLLHPSEEGFLAIGYVTESESAGMQYTTVVGIEFERAKTWQQFKHAIEQHAFPSKSVSVLWGDMTINQLQLPVNTTDKVVALASARCDFTIFNQTSTGETLYYAASMPATPTTAPLYHSKLRFTCMTLDYIRRILGVPLIPPMLGLLDFAIPCINASHAPKIMQSEYHLKQAINPHAPSAAPREVSKMLVDDALTTPPLGSSIRNMPTIETQCMYKVDLYNDEDGVVLSTDFASRLQSINSRIANIVVKGLVTVHQVVPATVALGPDDIILQIEAADASMVSAYFVLKQARRGLWNLYFRREYVQRSVYFQSYSTSARAENACTVCVVVASRHTTAVGDKLTTLHGQKCTVATTRSVMPSCDMLISATCLKRLPLGEVIYGTIVASIQRGRLHKSFAKACFGYNWLMLTLEQRRSMIAHVILSTLSTRVATHEQVVALLANTASPDTARLRNLLAQHTNPHIVIYTMRLTQEADTTMSYSSVGNVTRDSWVGQNRKGYINTGASCLTLPGMQSLERQGQTRLEHMVRRSAECPRSYTNIDGIAIDKSATTCLEVLMQFHTFDLSFTSTQLDQHY